MLTLPQVTQDQQRKTYVVVGMLALGIVVVALWVIERIHRREDIVALLDARDVSELEGRVCRDQPSFLISFQNGVT